MRTVIRKKSHVAVINKKSKYMNQEDEDYNSKENYVKNKGVLMDSNDFYHDDEFPFIEVDIIPEVKKNFSQQDFEFDPTISKGEKMFISDDYK